MNEPSRINLLELDIDVRLHSLWAEVREITNGWNLETAAAFMRAAYAKGYVDSLMEEKKGVLCTDHGYKLPRIVL